jgi:hypothetical protein
MCQPLHPLSTGGPHLGDLWHRQRTKQREAPHEAERTSAPACDQPTFLTQRPYPEEALGYLEHQLGDTLGLRLNDWVTLPRIAPAYAPRLLSLYSLFVDTYVVN